MCTHGIAGNGGKADRVLCIREAHRFHVAVFQEFPPDVSVGVGGLADAPGSALVNCRFLYSNKLSGTIPTELGKLANLEVL